MSKKLIPKCQNAWTPINYRLPNNQEAKPFISTTTSHGSNATSKTVKKNSEATEKAVKNQKIADRINLGSRTDEIYIPTTAYVDDEGEMQLQYGNNTILTTNGAMSGTDPVGEFYVTGEALGPIFKGIGRAAEWGLAKAGNQWARNRIVGRAFQKASNNDFKIPYLQAWKQSSGETNNIPTKTYDWRPVLDKALQDTKKYYEPNGSFTARARSKGYLSQEEANSLQEFLKDRSSRIHFEYDPSLQDEAHATSNLELTKDGDVIQTVHLNPYSQPSPYTIIHEGSHSVTFNYDPTNVSGWGRTIKYVPQNIQKPLKKMMKNAYDLGEQLEVLPEFSSPESAYQYYIQQGRSSKEAQELVDFLFKKPNFGKTGALDGYFKSGQEGRSYWLAGRQFLIDNNIHSFQELFNNPELFDKLKNIDLRWKLFTKESMMNNYKNMYAIPTTVGASLVLNDNK